MNDKLKFEDENKSIQSLKNSYNFIIKIDLEKSTAQCVHKNIERPVGISYDVVLSLDSANEYFLNKYIPQEDYETVKEFFGKILAMRERDNIEDYDESVQTVYSIRFDDGDIRTYAAALIILDKSIVLICGRDITDARPSHKLILRSQVYRKLHAHISSVLSFYRIWSLTFQIINRRVYFMFVCPEICEWMSLSDNEFWEIAEKGVSVDEFLTRLGLAERDFNRILRNVNECFYIKEKNGEQVQYYARMLMSNPEGKAVFTVFFSKEDFNNIYERLMTSNDSDGIVDCDYVESGAFIPGKDSKIWIRTFGNFDVFLDGVPIRFPSAKAKELLALLVDMRGGTLSAEEAVAYLWEDRPVDKQVMSNYRKVAMRLQNTLEKYGIGDLVINDRGVRNLNMAIVDCDLYRFLVNDQESITMFHGQYMQNYTWGETTLGMLSKRIERQTALNN